MKFVKRSAVGAAIAALVATLCLPAIAEAKKPGAPDEVVKARQKFFGIENVDANGNVKGDKVIFSWATNTTYAASIQGRVVLLDSYINRPELPTSGVIDRRRSPFLPDDFVDLKPEAIFLGHGHFDHADNAAYIAKWTGATIYASAETCAAMQADVTKMWNDPNPQNGGEKVIPDNKPVNCVSVSAPGSFPGNYDPTTNKSSVTRLSQLDPQVCILAFKFIHSGTAPVDSTFVHTPLANLGDPRYDGRTITTPAPAVTYPAMFPAGTPFTPPTNVANRVPGQLDTRSTGGIGGPYVIFYQFILKGGDNNFSFVWVNSAGPATEGIGADPGFVTLAQYQDPATPAATLALAKNIGAGLYSLMDTLPQTDVLFGSIVSLGATNNQQRDIIKVQQHLKPKVYYPGHLTDVAQAGSAIYHKINWRETALAMGFPQSDWPEFRLLVDPNDFMVPQVFDPDDKRWAKSSKGVPDLCRGK